MSTDAILLYLVCIWHGRLAGSSNSQQQKRLYPEVLETIRIDDQTGPSQHLVLEGISDPSEALAMLFLFVSPSALLHPHMNSFTSIDSSAGRWASPRLLAKKSNGKIKGTSSLAPGWQEAASDDGTPFYYNAETGVSQWEKPTAQVPAAKLSSDTPMATGWREIRSDDGQVFYYNDKTGASQWEKPTGKSSSSVAPSPPSTLLPGWREVTSEDGQVFYFNDDTGMSQWEMPISSFVSEAPIIATPPPARASRAEFDPVGEVELSEDGSIIPMDAPFGGGSRKTSLPSFEDFLQRPEQQGAAQSVSAAQAAARAAPPPTRPPRT